MVIAYILTFLSGSLFIAVLEVLVVCYFFLKLRRGRSEHLGRPVAINGDADSNITMEGDIWVVHLTPSQLQSAIKSQQSNNKQPKDRKSKKEVEELSTVLKDAKLESGVLSLTGADGVRCSINLEGSSIKAVSSSASANRKWAKKYPIKLEHKDQTLPDTICLLYFKTGREKELWCQALRAAASRETEERYSSLKVEFRDYLTKLKENSPDIFKLSTSSGKSQTRAPRKSVSWKRLLRKKTSKADATKAKTVSVQVGEAKCEDISRGNSLNPEEFESEGSFSDANQEGSTNGKKDKEAADTIAPEVATTSRLEGSIPALNIMFSRLFFDLYHGSALVNHLQRRVQIVLSRISTPSYITPLICTRIDIGKAPPMIHGLRAVPLVDDLWGVEADLAYIGGVVFTIETRLDLRESRSADNKFEASPAGAATADIISRSIQTVEDDLETTAESSEPTEQNAGSSKGGSRKRWTQWKAFVASLADQVSQVPLVLSMRLVSLKGSLQFRVKSAPSDRIWYGFSSMPELELVPEPSVGEHKITTGPLLSYIVERLQILIAETVVLPNCEDIYVPWMLADEDDWLQESSVPFPQPLPDAKGAVKSKRDRKSPTSGEPAAVPELKVPLLDNKPDDSDQDVEATKLLASSSDAAAAAAAAVDGQKKGRGSRRERVLNFGKKFVEEKTRNFAEKMRERFEKE